MKKLIEEAHHSYATYLVISGVLDSHQAKLSLLLWPDIAEKAIRLITLFDEKAMDDLKHDVGLVVFKPIEVIHESAMERVKEVTGKDPVKARKVHNVAIQTARHDPVLAKNTLIASVNKMFSMLNTLTDIEYPAVNKLEDVLPLE